MGLMEFSCNYCAIFPKNNLTVKKHVDLQNYVQQSKWFIFKSDDINQSPECLQKFFCASVILLTVI